MHLMKVFPYATVPGFTRSQALQGYGEARWLVMAG
jgi:hypothetical protein